MSNTTKSNGPLIKFDFLTLVDTIKAIHNESKGLLQNKPTIYYFPFTNSGNELLIVAMSRGSDPDFNCYYPKYPVKPGQKDSIGICIPSSRITLNKSYKINCNSIISQTINIRRIHEIKKD